jgi:hypothetical protein
MCLDQNDPALGRPVHRPEPAAVIKGGDVDLLIESKPAIGLLARAKIKWLLEQELNLPVDVVAADLDDVQTPFVAIARAHSRCLIDGSLINPKTPPLVHQRDIKSANLSGNSEWLEADDK